jgi:hypothetical protein
MQYSLEAFLWRRPHEVPQSISRVSRSMMTASRSLPAFNWLNHCAILAVVDPDKFSRPLRNFRKIVPVASDGESSTVLVPAAAGCWSSSSIPH